jgi:monothiol glutaredoxin
MLTLRTVHIEYVIVRACIYFRKYITHSTFVRRYEARYSMCFKEKEMHTPTLTSRIHLPEFRGPGKRSYTRSFRSTTANRGYFVTLSSSDIGPELKVAVDKFIAENKIVVFMKGSKDAPRCGFSSTVVQIFTSMNVPFETVDILDDDGLRAGMKIYSNWPTFPQVYIDGNFYGGCDICIGIPPSTFAK